MLAFYVKLWIVATSLILQEGQTGTEFDLSDILISISTYYHKIFRVLLNFIVLYHCDALCRIFFVQILKLPFVGLAEVQGALLLPIKSGFSAFGLLIPLS